MRPIEEEYANIARRVATRIATVSGDPDHHWATELRKTAEERPQLMRVRLHFELKTAAEQLRARYPKLADELREELHLLDLMPQR